MADSKVVTAFLKGKVSALLDEGQSERQVSRKVGVPKSTVHRWKLMLFPFPEKLDPVEGGRQVLKQAVINRLIESMSSRIRQVIELSGEVTKC